MNTPPHSPKSGEHENHQVVSTQKSVRLSEPLNTVKVPNLLYELHFQFDDDESHKISDVGIHGCTISFTAENSSLILSKNGKTCKLFIKKKSE